MNSRTRQYLFGLIFFGVGVYHLFIPDYLEASLYLIAGLAFIFNTLSSEPRLVEWKKALVLTTWVFIITTGILFLYLMQFKFM